MAARPECCTLFRYRPDTAHHPVHDGTCRKCWAVCKNPAQPGKQWCSECERAAMESGDLTVVSWFTEVSMDASERPGTILDDLEEALNGPVL